MSYKNIFLFLASFAFIYIASLKILLARSSSSYNKNVEIQPEVLAETDQSPEVIYGPKYAEIDQKKEIEPRKASISEQKKPKPSPTSSPSPDPTSTPTPTPTQTPTPSPTPEVSVEPTPTPDVWSPPEMEPIFARYAGQYGVDKNVLERLANCESHFNPNATNGVYVGLFQFGPTTWQSSRQQIGEDPNLDLRSDIEASIKTAAYVISVRGVSPWPSCLR